MKKILFAVATMAMLVACSTKPVQTIENLKTIANAAATAQAKYQAYAAFAQQDSTMANVAAMFQAAANAENAKIQGAMNELTKLGVTDFAAQADSSANVTLDSTTVIENLMVELTNVAPMDSSIIATATTEKADSVLTFLNNVQAVSQANAALFGTAVSAYQAAKQAADAAAAEAAAKPAKPAKKGAKAEPAATAAPAPASVIPATWIVCSACGAITNDAAATTCPVCGQPIAQ